MCVASTDATEKKAELDVRTEALCTIDRVLGGRVTVDLSLEFLYRRCKSDLNILRRAKASVEQRSSIW